VLRASLHAKRKYVLFAADHFPGERNGKTVGQVSATVPHAVEFKRSQGCDSGLSVMRVVVFELDSKCGATCFLQL